MFCSSCGTRLDGAKFCSSCGAAAPIKSALTGPIVLRTVTQPAAPTLTDPRPLSAATVSDAPTVGSELRTGIADVVAVSWPVLLGAGVLVILLVLVFAMKAVGDGSISAPSYGNTAQTSRNPNDDVMAQVVCEKWVKTQLKAPATAQFDTATRTSLGNDRYHISGPVDAENGYGALIRNTYDCTVAFTGADTYRYESVVLNEQ